MADASLLSDLCAICHTQPRKYTCPRCSLQSCSLPCVKRHKLRSQCSGMRDPARYYKRGELATPTTLDQDFNFITGIERSLERAERTTLRRGIPTVVDEKLYKGEARLRAEIEKSGALVRKAPNGMSRNRLNATRWHKRQKRLFWTVEWILPESRHITNNSETELIRDLFTKLSRERSQASREKISERPKTKYENRRSLAEVGQVNKNIPEEAISNQPAYQQTPDLAANAFFYLHQPLSCSNTPALISLAPDSTLAAAVRGQVLLEFPTIYVLPNPPDGLPAGYVSWSEESQPLLLNQEMRLLIEDSDFQASEATTSIDPAKIVETLQKDLAG